jgi:ATP adenylyltransferase
MDRLWSPWRYRYVSTAQPSDACIFCEKPKSNDDRSSLIVYRAERTFILLNLFFRTPAGI